jgi:hydroxymethylbilane synthase
MRVGTRGSALALAQAELVGRELIARGAIERYELVPVLTSGDRGLAREDKSRWIAELEQALVRGEVDLAVHSAKDVPAQLSEGLSLLGAPARAAAEDALCGPCTLSELPSGARVGTSSLRRRAQLSAARADVEVVPVRGNVDTRLRKLSERAGELDALVLARAALQRLEREDEARELLDPERFVPAPGQGVLALQGRNGDERAQTAAAAINDPDAFACLLAERALARELQATCNTPLGAHATPEGQAGLRLRAWLGLPDGSAWLFDELQGTRADPERLGGAVARRMRLAGADQLLQQARLMAQDALQPATPDTSP